MLHAIKNDILYWKCSGGEEDELCGAGNSTHIDNAIYMQQEILATLALPALNKQAIWKNKRGPTIALPPCSECGAQTFLKADYTLKELCKVVQSVMNEQGQIWAYTLPLRHIFNLYAHWLLYIQGRADVPILPMPSQEVLNHPQFAAINSPETVLSLWFGFSVMRETGQLPAIENTTFSQLFIAQEVSS
jgi:hypothetical protein